MSTHTGYDDTQMTQSHISRNSMHNGSTLPHSTPSERTNSSELHTPRRIKPLEELIHASWARALSSVEPDIRRMGDFIRSEHQRGLVTAPPAHQILRAFTYPLDSIKVLIVGQDPYPTLGHAVGLSFSVAPNVRPIPKSLINIYKELHDDIGCSIPSSGDLTPWADQGVMLLNRSLSVVVGSANSHRDKGWEKITEEAVRVLNSRTDTQGNPLPLVAILWGNQAQSLAPLLTHAAIFTSPHPSPLSAYKGFFGSRPFSRTNEALSSLGAQPINWQLP